MNKLIVEKEAKHLLQELLAIDDFPAAETSFRNNSSRLKGGGPPPPDILSNDGNNDDNGDSLEKFFKDIIYIALKDKTLKNSKRDINDIDEILNSIIDIAEKLAFYYAKQVEKLGVSYSEVEGGSADDEGFSIELTDGREIIGDSEKAKFIK